MLFLSNQRLRKWQRKFQLFKEISLFFFQISFYLILLALSPLDYHQFLALSPLTPVIFIPTSPAYFFFFFHDCIPHNYVIALQDSKKTSLLSLSKSLTSKLILVLVLISFTLPLTCLFGAPAMTASSFFLD